jgi:hypothetical protein
MVTEKQARKYEYCKYHSLPFATLEWLIRETLGNAAAEKARTVWNWKYESAPDFFEAGKRVFAMRFNGEFVGFHGTVCGTIKIGPKTYPLVWGTDYMVHPSHRGRGVQLLKAFMVRQPEVLQMGTPFNSRAYDLEIKLGCRDIGRIMSYKQVLRPRVFFKDRKLVVKIGLYFLCSSLSLVSGFTSIFRKKSDVVLSQQNAFAESVDAFFIKVADDYGAISVRTASFLNWRFSQCPHRQYSVLFARRAGVLAGYLVYCSGNIDGHEKGYIVDMLIGKKDSPVLASLLSKAVRDMRKNGVEVVDVSLLHSQPWVSHALRASGFMLKKARLPVIYGPQGLGGTFLSDVKGWYLTSLESDFEVM